MIPSKLVRFTPKLKLVSTDGGLSHPPLEKIPRAKADMGCKALALEQDDHLRLWQLVLRLPRQAIEVSEKWDSMSSLPKPEPTAEQIW